MNGPLAGTQQPDSAHPAGRPPGGRDGFVRHPAYGKCAPGIFRTASMLRHAVERRQPNRLGLGAD
jgi:hypothetical protein